MPNRVISLLCQISKNVRCLPLQTQNIHNAAGGVKDFRSQLIDTFLNLEELDPNLYRAHHLLPGMKDSLNVFGGQVIGQALQAAGRTVVDLSHVFPHSMQCHFLRYGDTRKPILYMVDRVRDGKSFSMRHVRAIQNGEPIFTAHGEPDSILHQRIMPKYEQPEDCLDANEKFLNVDHQKAFITQRENLPTTFQMRPVVSEMYRAFQSPSPTFAAWVKTNDPIGDDDRLHHCVAGFISDISMIQTALLPHIMKGFRVGMATTLNHCAGRAMIYGRLWTREGRLVMTTAQEACIR